MNFRRTNLVKIASIYAVLFAYFKEENKQEEEPYKSLLNSLLSLLDFYLYGEGKKEIPVKGKIKYRDGQIGQIETTVRVIDVALPEAEKKDSRPAAGEPVSEAVS